jgi:hypothetical protein
MRKESVSAPALALEYVLTSGCTSGNCPTMYRTNRGTFVVQGYAVTPEQAGVELPDGELLVEIPLDLLAGVIRILDGRTPILDKPMASNSVKH